MTLQQNTDHIQTTHIGSLPRPHALLDLMKAKFTGQPFDADKFEALLAQSVNDVVRKQVDCGIEIVTDGEFSKPGFFTYIQERLEGFEARPGQKMKLFVQEVAAFPDYYKEYFKTAMMGGAIVALAPVVCVGPVKYRGERFVRRDIANVKNAAAAAGVPDHHVFLPATAASGVGLNEYYKSAMKSIFMRWRPSSARNTAPSPTPAFWYRSTIRSCRIFSSSPTLTARR